MIGQFVDIDLKGGNFKYKSKKFSIKNSIIEDFKITNNTEKIKLIVT
jgi:hypothetical protein